MVVRRLIASMALLACLVGTVQPVIACASCSVRTDCCPTGSPAGGSEQRHQTSPGAQASDCCALSAAITPSVSAVGARTPQGHASGSSAAIALPAVIRAGQRLPEPPTSAAKIAPLDQTLTYLRTARLRL